MRFFITGGAGFIGSHLATRLLDSGHQVEILDNLSTGSVDNIASLKDREGFGYQVGSIDNEPLLAEMIDRADVVYHLAAAVGVFLIVEDPVQCIETNITGTSVVLRHAIKKKKKVFVASTSELYGKSDRVPYAEDDDLILGPTTHARWSYSASKAIDEFLSLAYYRQKDLPIVICRFFNTVGPRQVGRYGMVMPRFVHQALEGGPITVYGDGQQSRCFCDVGDVTRALEELATCEEAVGQVFNIGSDQEITIQGLAEKIRDRVDPSVEIKKVSYEDAYAPGFEDIRRRVPDLSKIRRVIGYEPQYNLDQIIDRVIAHFREEGVGSSN